MVTITFQIEAKGDKICVACAADMRAGTDAEKLTAKEICEIVFKSQQAEGMASTGITQSDAQTVRNAVERALKDHGMSYEHSPIAKALGTEQPNPN